MDLNIKDFFQYKRLGRAFIYTGEKENIAKYYTEPLDEFASGYVIIINSKDNVLLYPFEDLPVDDEITRIRIFGNGVKFEINPDDIQKLILKSTMTGVSLCSE